MNEHEKDQQFLFSCFANARGNMTQPHSVLSTSADLSVTSYYVLSLMAA